MLRELADPDVAEVPPTKEFVELMRRVTENQIGEPQPGPSWASSQDCEPQPGPKSGFCPLTVGRKKRHMQ